MKHPPPISASDVPCTWIAACKNASANQQVRACPTQPTIERWVPDLKQWGVVMLPTNAVAFTTVQERDAVWAKLQETK